MVSDSPEPALLPETPGSEVGAVVGPVAVGPIAHGGHCVARYDGRVIFVRHALPGESVRVRLTDTSRDRYWLADAVEVLVASPHRVPRRCPISGPGLCGGCDFQHVELSAQRRLKTAVVAEQLHRLAGIDWTGQVEEVPIPGSVDGLAWRTRMRYRVASDGRAGLRAHHSHAIIPLPPTGCPIAAPTVPAVADRRWPPGTDLVAAAGPDSGALLVDGTAELGSPVLTERSIGRDWTVAADGFWQVHPGAADTLAAAVLGGLEPQPGETALDLYCGVGLFCGALADAGCAVWAVEGDKDAARLARQNLSDASPRVRVHTGRVDRMLPRLPKRVDLVVLDPPRSGAGRTVIPAIAARQPRSIAYVACDPAALARDLAFAAAHGYRPVSVRAFDLFPMTRHIECVAILQQSEAQPWR